MNTSVQTLFTKIIVKLLILSAFFAFTNASAADFRAKSLNGSQGTVNRNWNNPGTWEILNSTTNTWIDATRIPNFADKVLINDGNRVETTDLVLECLQLTVFAPDRTANPTSLLNIGNTHLRVYGNILVTNGATQGNVRVAEIIVGNNGILEATGSITPNSNTTPINDNNRITVNGNGLVVPNSNITPLPVQLTSFTATKKKTEVALNWETASEKNCKGFEIQTSADGKNYEGLAFINSQNGSSSQAQRYAFTHKTGNREGLIYYRLKQVDLDGTVAFYHAKVVDLGRFTNAATLYPNPFQSAFKIKLQATDANKAEIHVKDLTGRTIVHNEPILVKGTNELEITLNNVAPGVYLVYTTVGDISYLNRIVKQ